MTQEYSKEQIQGYLDGFRAAVEQAESIRAHATPGDEVEGEQFNNGMSLGMQQVGNILRTSLGILTKDAESLK